MTGDEPAFGYTYISLGAGVQSLALYILSTLDRKGVPPADLAVFADTGDEPHWVYEQLEAIKRWGKLNYGPRIEVVSAGVLSEDIIQGEETGERWASIPLHTIRPDGKRGILRRQCTSEYKIRPIEHYVKRQMGYKKWKHVKEQARTLIGITIDESSRMRTNRTRWITNAYPLVDAGLTREDCAKIVMQELGLTPKKSACVFCPYRNNAAWADLKFNHPGEWEKAVEFDKRVRNLTSGGVKYPAYVHPSCKPLDEVDLDEDDAGRYDMFTDECEGMCGL